MVFNPNFPCVRDRDDEVKYDTKKTMVDILEILNERKSEIVNEQNMIVLRHERDAQKLSNLSKELTSIQNILGLYNKKT